MKRSDRGSMFWLLYNLVRPLQVYVDGKYHTQTRFIVLSAGKPVWYNPYPPNPEWDDRLRNMWLESEWPEISPDYFRRMMKKGWLEEFVIGQAKIWGCSEYGKAIHKQLTAVKPRYCRGKSVISKYRKFANKRKIKPVYQYFEREDPEPILPPRRPKVKHHGYRRPCQRNWLEEELDCYDPNKLPSHLR